MCAASKRDLSSGDFVLYACPLIPPPFFFTTAATSKNGGDAHVKRACTARAHLSHLLRAARCVSAVSRCEIVIGLMAVDSRPPYRVVESWENCCTTQHHNPVCAVVENQRFISGARVRCIRCAAFTVRTLFSRVHAPDMFPYCKYTLHILYKPYRFQELDYYCIRAII